MHRAHRLKAPPDAAITASVSVIVPVRDELRNIGACLRGLAAQRGLGAHFSIIVVDDDSQDGTAGEVAVAAQADPRITLAIPGPLPRGWMGKPHACWHGAIRAEGDWLCFVDADVQAAPYLIAAAIAVADRQRADMVSLQPFQELGSLWERLIIPAGLLMIACAKDLQRADDPRSPEVTANGQFILIRREAYFDVGGHAAVRGEVCEDRALAGLVKRGGWRLRLLAGDSLARTRMYRDFASLWEGFSKNATEIMGGVGATLAVAIAGVLVAWSAVGLPLILALNLARQQSAPAGIALALAMLGSAVLLGVHLATARHFHIPAPYALLFPLAYAAAAALAWHSAVLRRKGQVSWKGRTYDIGQRAAPKRG